MIYWVELHLVFSLSFFPSILSFMFSKPFLLDHSPFLMFCRYVEEDPTNDKVCRYESRLLKDTPTPGISPSCFGMSDSVSSCVS